jgi:hypothetical protein
MSTDHYKSSRLLDFNFETVARGAIREQFRAVLGQATGYLKAGSGRTCQPAGFGPSTQTLTSYGSDFLIQGPNALPNLGAGNFTAATTNAGPFTGSDHYEVRDVVDMTKGKHSLFVGGEFALDKTMFFADLLNFGTISFATSAPTSTGNQMSDWVTGQILTPTAAGFAQTPTVS